MQQTDDAIRTACIEVIRKRTLKRPSYPLSTIFETGDMTAIRVSAQVTGQDGELPIVLVYDDGDNWSLLTTQRIISTIKGERKEAPVSSISKYTWKDYKGYRENAYIFGHLTLADKSQLDILIETGVPSSIMIYGIMTITDLYKSSEQPTEQAAS